MLRTLSLYFLFLLLFSPSNSIAQKTAGYIPLKKFKINSLSHSLNENSGLTFWNNQLLSINDGGNSATLYFLNPQNGNILKTQEIPYKNIDFEAITSKDSLLYIGDFGNNLGNRKDLKIIEWNPYSTKSRIYPFFYPEQKTFRSKKHRHSWDAESLFFSHGKLQVLTKDWAKKETSRYQINLETSSLEKALFKENVKLRFMATDAALYAEKLYIVGYTRTFRVFLAVFQQNEKGDFFTLSFQRYFLGNAWNIGQIEGITINEKGIYISSEKLNLKIKKNSPYLYFIPKEKLPFQY